MPKQLSMERPGVSSTAPAEQGKEQLLRMKAKEIYAILTKRDIRRAQPTDAKGVEEAIFDSLRDRRKVEFTFLWPGVKDGPTGKADEYDVAALERIAKVRTEIQTVLNTIPEYNRRAHLAAGFQEGRWARGRWFIDEYYVKANVLFCDMHHRLASGKKKEQCSVYYDGLEKEVKSRDLNIERLDKYYLWEYERKRRETPWYVRMLSCFSFTPSECEFYPVFSTESITKRCDELCKDARFMSDVQEMAKKHSMLYRKGMSLESLAKAYIEVELGFLDYMKRENGQDHIFVSYSKPCVQGPLFGKTLALYWYPIKRGDSRLPSFRYEGEQKCEDNTRTEQVDGRAGINYRRYVLIKKAVRLALVIAANAVTLAYLSGNYAIPYTLLAGKAAAETIGEDSKRWADFRDKYYRNRKDVPTLEEFRNAGALDVSQIKRMCSILQMPVPVYAITINENKQKMKGFYDVKKSETAELIKQGDKALEEGGMTNERSALSAYLKAREIEPESITIKVRLAMAAEALGHLNVDEINWLEANYKYLKTLKEAKGQ